MNKVELLKSYVGKYINIGLGSGGVMPGKLVSVNDDYIIMDTRWSTKHHYVMDKIGSFWADEDKASED